MPGQSQRYSEYLSSYHFFPNSIEFRIISSKAMEKWKNVQSFQLNQLINGKFFFAQDRREILLLKYDMWSRWLVEIENMFIELHESNDKVRQKDLDSVVKLCDKTAEKYEYIIVEEHAHHFTEEFSKVWIESHKVAYKHLISDIRKMHGSYENVFIEIVNVLSEIMQYTLTEIHEINEMFAHQGSDEIFLTITPYCSRVFEQTGECITTERAKIYNKYFDFKKIWFKNYTDHNLPEAIVSAVESAGFEVDYKKTVFN